MPELPDLTVFAANLHRRLQGKVVSTVECHSERRLNAPPEAVNAALAGKALEKVERWGKETDFIFAGGAVLRIHLMLNGRFVLSDHPYRLRDRVLTVRFDDGTSLVVTDPKGLAKAALPPKDSDVPDALDATAGYLREKAARKPKTLAKGFLVDQAVVRGIGNAYADEILWEAKISPKSAVGRIPPEKMEELVAAIRTVLADAVANIRAADPDITGGEIRDFLRVHNPQRSQSPTGHPILKEMIASKKTYYTEEQVLY